MNNHHPTSSPRPALGILEWFRPGEYREVESALADLKRLGIRHLRTGISWADWYVEGTPEWYDWLLPRLSSEVELLPCFLYTPPSIGEKSRTSSPPRDLKAYADFVAVMIDRYGDHFQWVELWNEPNNRIEYDFTLDFSWNKFATMIDMAAHWAHVQGKKVLLGGMSPIDPNWLQIMYDKKALKDVDAVGIHGFPHVFDQQWDSWEAYLTAIREVIDANNGSQKVWVSEAGFSTWQHDEVQQVKEFKKAISSSAERVYWYSLKDLHPKNPTVGGYHLDEREYFFGLKKTDGTEKLLYKLLAQNGAEELDVWNIIDKRYVIPEDESYTLITGGAGFIGTNLAHRLLSENKKVMVYDNLSRPGVEINLKWLKERHGDNLIIQIADIKEKRVLQECVRHAEMVFHLSAQVAVTTSVVNPQHDFDVNMGGTFDLLEAVRLSDNKPPVIFTSTNKVYGLLGNVSLEETPTRYEPNNQKLAKWGVDENQTLDFHSPYGCSKGAADHYLLDYARSFGIQTAVFRMSCIYGPHQFGTEDQGWVAHFLISAMKGEPITVYGDGKQVRDILYVDDLIDAFELARDHMSSVAGEAFNIGGGPNQTVSLLEIINYISNDVDKNPEVSFDDWRIGDQRYYTSDIRKFADATGWRPKVPVREGLSALHNWLTKNRPEMAEHMVVANQNLEVK